MTERIDALLREKHLSRRELAIKAGMPPSSLQSAMQRNGSMTIAMIEKLAEALECSPAWLCGWEERGKCNLSTGEKIRAARKKAGLTQRELAEKLAIPETGISQWENGVRNAKIGSIKKIANALGVPFESLISDTDEERSNLMSKNDDTTNLAALGAVLGTMGTNRGTMIVGEEKRDADKSCAKALTYMAGTMETLSDLVRALKNVEKPDEFDHENIVELTGKMATLATSMSTLRMSMGLGAAPLMPGGYPTA